MNALLLTSFLSLSVLLFFGSIELVHADIKSDVLNAAVEDAGARCKFAGESAGYKEDEKYSEINMKIIAQDSFNARGFSGEWWSAYENKFLENCITGFNKGLEESTGIPRTYEEVKIHKEGYRDGLFNQECANDGKLDAQQKKPLSQPNSIDIQVRAATVTVYDSKIDKERWQPYFNGFREGCIASYNSAYASELEDTPALVESAYVEGTKSGESNSECKNAGRTDYLEDKPKSEPGFFIIEGQYVQVNPYVPVVEQEKWDQFREGFLQGCKNAYDKAYEQEKRKDLSNSGDGGCLIATAAYGTELSQEVQNLREIRNKMYETELGGNVMHAVNDFYYSFSPTVADWERQNPVFKETVKILITPSVTSFTMLDHNSIDSEVGLIGYVMGVVTINIGMYFASPAVVIWQIQNRM